MSTVRLSGVVFALLLASLSLSACSDVAQRSAAERERYHAYAGPPVDRMTWLGRYDGWHPLGGDELVVWTTPFDAYLIKVLPPCVDLPFANSIGLTSTARTVSARFDFVLVHAPGQPRGRAFEFRCPISEIRPVDYRRMRHDLRNHTLPGAPAQPVEGSPQSGSGTV